MELGFPSKTSQTDKNLIWRNDQEVDFCMSWRELDGRVMTFARIYIMLGREDKVILRRWPRLSRHVPYWYNEVLKSSESIWCFSSCFWTLSISTLFLNYHNIFFFFKGQAFPATSFRLPIKDRTAYSSYYPTCFYSMGRTAAFISFTKGTSSIIHATRRIMASWTEIAYIEENM